MNRFHRLLALALVLASTGVAAQERRLNPKALARYDVSYVRCEASFPEMKGHRDDAYLALWRIAPGPKATARLASVRGSSAYKAEQKVAAAGQAKRASEPESVKALERQCRGLWGEMGRLKPAR